MSVYNYYKATWSVVTARRARLMGIPVSRNYGYVVLIDPPVMYEGKKPGCGRLEAWYKTKAIAQHSVESDRYAQQMGYFACPCGSNKQAKYCCGIPKAILKEFAFDVELSAVIRVQAETEEKAREALLTIEALGAGDIGKVDDSGIRLHGAENAIMKLTEFSITGLPRRIPDDAK